MNQRRSILVVDDNPTSLKLARVLLASEGYVVQTAGDAEEALLVLETFSPDMILIDIQLPGMDGLELTRRLRCDPAHRNIVIVAFTAYAMKGDDERMMASGCHGYIAKPIDVDTLLASIAGFFARQLPTGER